jgi:hypothetical protein
MSRSRTAKAEKPVSKTSRKYKPVPELVEEKNVQMARNSAVGKLPWEIQQSSTNTGTRTHHVILTIVCLGKEYDQAWQWDEELAEKAWHEDACIGSIHKSNYAREMLWLQHPIFQQDLPMIGITALGSSFAVWQTWQDRGLAMRETMKRNLAEIKERLGLDAATLARRDTTHPFIDTQTLMDKHKMVAQRYLNSTQERKRKITTKS